MFSIYFSVSLWFFWAHGQVQLQSASICFPARVSFCLVMAAKFIRLLIDELFMGIIFHLRSSEVVCVCVVEFARCGYKWKIMRRMQISRWEPEPCDGYDGNMWFLAYMKNQSQDGSDNSSTNTNSKLLYNTFTCVYSSPLISVFVVELHLFSAVCALVSVAVMC